jgi:hypothetical protein
MLDHTIDHAHRQAEAMERDAKAIDDRLAALGVPADWMGRRRGLGQLRNPYSKAFGNLTAQAILEQKDRGLAFWLAQREGTTISGVDYAAAERQQQQADSLRRMQENTAALRAQNQARNQRYERERTHGRWTSEGKWVS